MLLEYVRLLDDLPRVGKQLVSFVRERHATIGAREYVDAEFALEFLDGNREIRL